MGLTGLLSWLGNDVEEVWKRAVEGEGDELDGVVEQLGGGDGCSNM